VGLNAGYLFGPGGEGFERLNLGCPRSVLEEGLQRIKTAVKEFVHEGILVRSNEKESRDDK